MRYLSLFSGIEAATVAWSPLGWEPVAFADNDPFCCRLLAHHYPGIPNLGNVSAITESRIKSLGAIDVVVFGSPCQDLSVAGKRAGIQGERSGLFFRAMDIVRWSNARYTVWENVPGAFSSNSGRDFAAVVGAMVGMEPHVPTDGWRNSGVAIGPDAYIEWCVLDAQYFNLAQRRERLFIVRCTRGYSTEPVLLERSGLSWHPAPSRKAREDIAGCLGGGTGERGLCSDANAGGQVAVAFGWNKSAHQTMRVDGETVDALQASPQSNPAVMLHDSVRSPYAVRRLTPREAERLQGFPDDYTLIPTHRKKAKECGLEADALLRYYHQTERGKQYVEMRDGRVLATADGPRYRALGNSFPVPVIRWIGKRIQAVSGIVAGVAVRPRCASY